jgi:hypothetical protein
MLRTDLSSIESLRSLRPSVQILLYRFLESVLDRGDLKIRSDLNVKFVLTPQSKRRTSSLRVVRR